jgi:beta-galactosidase
MQPITEWTADNEGVLCGEFTYPFSWVERQIFVRVEGVGKPYEVIINGKRAGGSTNGHAATEFNITKLSREDKNSLQIRILDNKEMAAIESFDIATSTPIAYVMSQPRVRVRDIYYRATKGVGSVVNVDFGAIMHNQTLGEKTSRIYYELYLNDTTRLSAGHLDVNLGMYGVDTMRFGAPVPDSVLWSSNTPTQLSLRLKNRIAGRDVEFYDIPLSLRELRYDNGTFYINGNATQIEWAEVSPNATAEDIASLHSLGHRAIRFTAGGVAEETLTACDSLGIYVAITAPINSSKMGTSRKRGGNPSNNPRWKQTYIERVMQMIYTTKRHPSVIAYYLAEESANGICLYEAYLAAKAISGDRPVFYEDGNGEWNSDK